jgi:hypothetical protein
MSGLSFDLIALQLFTGLALGAIYVLFAIGLSLIFGMLTVVNFAHGAFYMIGAYVGLFLLSLGGNFWLCLVAVPLIVGVSGMIVERFLIRPLYGRGIDYPLLLTFGLSYVMVELIRIAFGKSGYPFDTPDLLQGAINIGVGYFPLYRLFVIGAAVVVLLGLWLFLEKTSFGLIIRAGARAWRRCRPGLALRVRHRHRDCRHRRIAGGAAAGPNSRNGCQYSGGGLRGYRGRRHGVDRRRGDRRPAGRRCRQHDVAVRAGNGEGLDLRSDGRCIADPPARLLRPRRAHELKSICP